MAAGRVKDDTVRVGLGLDLFEHLERRQVERDDNASFAVIRITFAVSVRHGDAMRTARHPLDDAYDMPLVPSTTVTRSPCAT